MTHNTARICALSTIIICSLVIMLAPDDALAALNPPTSLTATATGKTTSSISFTSPGSSGSDTLRGFQILRATPGGSFTIVVSNSTDTSLADSGLTLNTQYDYKILALYNLGRTSTPVNATIYTPTAGSLCTGDCDAPTLGVSKQGSRLVDSGFSYNGNPVDVELFYTPYPLITTKVGVQNKAVFKIFEDGGPNEIRHLDLAFGLAKGQTLGDSKARIELDRTWDGVETVNVVDPQNALQNVKVETANVICSDETARTECLQVTISHTFREQLDFDIVATNVWDENRNSWQNYYNHGVHVEGESLNPADQYMGVHRGHLYSLTETGKNMAVDEYGNVWSFEYGTWSREYVKPEQITDQPTQIMTRTHSEFGKLVQHEREVATKLVQRLCYACGTDDKIHDIFTYEYSDRVDKLSDPKILEKMKAEEMRAKQKLE